jgi:hypothetical protein
MAASLLRINARERRMTLVDITSQQLLRYVSAGSVQGPVGDFARLPVETPDRKPLGRFAGFVVDLVSRRLKFMVIETSRWRGRRWLVPFSLVTLDRERGALQLENDAPFETCPEFDPAAIRELGDDDLRV